MSDLRLTYAGLEYFDRAQSLYDGSVKPHGIDLNYLIVPPGELFRRVARHAEFDVAEFSVSTLTALVSRGDTRFVAIPVFPSRNFRHGYLWINTSAGIARPEDLKGKRIGVPEYQMTAALWIRAALQHDHGVAPADMHWMSGGLWAPGYEERAKIALPPEITFSIIPEDRYLEEMLDAGDIDALFSPARPRSFMAGEGKVARLFPNFREVEKDYYRRTGIFPIMHLIAIPKKKVEALPWLPASLFKAFEAAKDTAVQRLLEENEPMATYPWIDGVIKEAQEFMGEDFWPYGLEPNRKTLEAFLGYHFDQGLAARRLSIEEIFVPSTLSRSRI